MSPHPCQEKAGKHCLNHKLPSQANCTALDWEDEYLQASAASASRVTFPLVSNTSDSRLGQPQLGLEPDYTHWHPKPARSRKNPHRNPPMTPCRNPRSYSHCRKPHRSRNPSRNPKENPAPRLREASAPPRGPESNQALGRGGEGFWVLA